MRSCDRTSTFQALPLAAARVTIRNEHRAQIQVEMRDWAGKPQRRDHRYSHQSERGDQLVNTPSMRNKEDLRPL